jgi:CubicO group peptidase (beta-lactamase class C family)
MQRINRRGFLQNVGYGALSLPLDGKSLLVPLGKRPKTLPAVLKPLVPFGTIAEQAIALLTAHNLPGIAIGLIRSNKLVYAGGFGVMSVDTHQPMTEYSIMMVGSMCKGLTGAAIMQLQEAGRLDLDDAFVKHVPYFKMQDPRYKKITIRHLLAHTSGLPEYTPTNFLGQGLEVWNTEDAAERQVRSLDGGLMLCQDPGGSEFLYSVIGYGILGALIQEITGELFEDYQRHHLLDPLHMFNSTFLFDEVKPWELTARHLRDANNNPITLDHRKMYARNYAAAAFLYSNIVDMSHWIMANINGGFYCSRVLRPETQAQLWVSLYDGAWDWPGVGYNSGFWIMNYAEEGIEPLRMILGNGGGPGISTHITIFPDQGIAAIVFVNLKAKPDDPSYSWGICDHLAIQMLRGEL